MGRLAKNVTIIGAGATLFLLSVAVMALIGGFYDARYPFENEVIYMILYYSNVKCTLKWTLECLV